MTYSLLNADRDTYCKIIGIAAAAAVVFVAVGFNARNSDTVATKSAQPDSAIVKAGKPATYSSSDKSALR